MVTNENSKSRRKLRPVRGRSNLFEFANVYSLADLDSVGFVIRRQPILRLRPLREHSIEPALPPDYPQPLS